MPDVVCSNDSCKYNVYLTCIAPLVEFWHMAGGASPDLVCKTYERKEEQA